MFGESGTGLGRERNSGGRRRLFTTVLLACVAGLAICASSALALSPSVGSKAASNVGETTVTLNGTVNPNGLETKAYFEYGTTVAYGSKTAEVSVGSGSSSLEIAKAVTGLTAHTEYHFRIVATNADGTSTGGDKTFTVGWKVQTPAAGGTISRDVSCTAANECTAVGDGGNIQRWNGTEWKAQTVAKPAGGTQISLSGVSCVSSTACTAVGRYFNSSEKWATLAEFWNGTEWKVQTTPAPEAAGAELEDVSCSSSTACTAVGNHWTLGPPEASQTLALRWNGTEWKTQTTPNPFSSSPRYTAVSCPTSSFCMATGFYYDSAKAKWVPLAGSWETEWTARTAIQPEGSTMSWFYSVSCTSSTACTAVGDKEINAGTHQHQTVAQRWNGSSWSLQTTPNPEGTNLEFTDVTCISSTSCTGTGSTRSGENNTPMILSWNGSTWSSQLLKVPSGSKEAFPFGISCIASRGCVVVGRYWISSANAALAEANWRGAAPTATTTAASSVGEKTATVNATVNPNGTETKAYFEYGTTTSYGSKTAEVNLNSGTSAVETNAALTGLSPATTYHYRIVANNENPETSVGSDLTFRTSGAPTVSTLPADTHSSGEGATLTGSVNPNGLSTTYQFEYGTSPGALTNTVPAVAESAGSGTESKAVSYTLSGLTKGKTYYYRITATNSAGKSNGGESSFTTPSAAEATTEPAVKITKECATVKGTVKRNGLATKYWFEYGLTASYGSKTSTSELGAGTSSVPVEAKICGLSPGTLYHFRLAAENGLGTGNGSDQTFTTVSVALKVEGSLLKAGTALKAFSSNFSFTPSGGGSKHSCEETELSGEVAKNPGATVSVTAPKMQNAGGARCNLLPPGTFFTMQYAFPSAISMEYTVDEEGEPIVTTNKFKIVGTPYAGTSKATECEWEAELSGEYSFSSPLKYTLTGTATLVKAGYFLCFATEALSGEFTVTSGGLAVEATP